MRTVPIDGRTARGLGGLLFVALMLTLIMTGTLRSLVSPQGRHEVRVQFAQTHQLMKGSDVRIDGVDAGKVERVELDPGGRSSTVLLKVDDDATPLYRDARAVARWKTVLGGAFYVDLEAGSPDAGPLGDGPIPASRTESQVEIEDISSVLQPNAVRGLRRLPSESADALQDRSAPGRLLEDVADISPDAEGGLRALRGQILDRDLRGLVAETARTVAAFDRPDDRTRKLVAGASATLATTAARADDLRRTLAAAPHVLRDSERTFTRLTGTLELADPLLADLRAPAAEVGPTLARLYPTLTGANRLLRRAEPLLASLRPAARSLARAAKSGLPLVRELEPSIERIDKTVLPMLSEKDKETTKSTAVMIGGTLEGLAAGAGGQMDRNGHFIRFPATSGSSPLYSAPCQTYFANPDAEQMIACQTFQEALKTYLSYSPLSPTPGTEPPPGRATRRAGR